LRDPAARAEKRIGILVAEAENGAFLPFPDLLRGDV
jgi:hypothetical protein